MSATSAIEWTDKTWNPVTGCDKVSPGCAHCYAEGVANRFWSSQYVHTVERGFIAAKAYAGDRMTGTPRQFTDVMAHEDRLLEPLSWRKSARVFVNSMSDLFHEAVPDQFIDRVFDVMMRAPQHTFQILTKRPTRMREYMLANVDVYGHAPRNVWLGVSVENQHFADERIPLLLHTPAAVRFISAEPLLGPVDVIGYVSRDVLGVNDAGRGLDWVIVGGESGPGARPMQLEWAESIISQCRCARIPVFMKQLGSSWRGISFRVADGINQRITDRKGGDLAEWPEYLRVREFPAPVAAG